MRSLALVLAALFSAAVANTDCTKGNSSTCCQGYTYNDITLHKRTVNPPVCDGSVPPGPGVTPPTCTGRQPVCTTTDTIPQGSGDFTLYCGNPLANTGQGTVKGTVHVEVGPCQTGSGFCFILTATAPTGTTLDADYKVQISLSKITSDVSGKFPIQVTSQPIYVPFSLVYGTTKPCSTGPGTVWLALHGGEGGQTCWAGNNPGTPLVQIPNNNKNWALQFSFSFTCKDVCTSYCCCPPPPSIPDCTTDGAFSVSCPGLCSPPKTGASCDLIHVPNPTGWTTTADYADVCCCKPPDNPHCTSGIETTVAPGAATCPAGNYGQPVLGNIADCNSGLFNEVCCCTPSQCSAGSTTAGECPATPPPGKTCTTENDGCGGKICCCTTNPCTPNQQCPTGATQTAGQCPATPPSGQTCTQTTDGCDPICCCSASGTCTTGTAFGVPAGCAPGLTCSINTLKATPQKCGRWGWYINVNPTPGSGSLTTFTLHTGAGKNDLSKGADVGIVVVQPCSAGSTQWCAFYSTTASGWVITAAHVEVDCGTLDTRTAQNFPCAPGGYNLNDGGSCGQGGLPGTSWTSAPFPSCTNNDYVVIFHAAVAQNQPNCSPTNCGDSDTGTGPE